MIRAEWKTTRLWLRPVASRDEKAVLTAFSDPNVTRWLVRVPTPYVPAEFKDFVENLAHPGQTFAIDDGTGMVGGIELSDELGYWIAPWAQGKGYAREAARAVLAAWFAQSGDPVRAHHLDDNLRSARLLASLGFLETGRGAGTLGVPSRPLRWVNVELTKSGWILAQNPVDPPNAAPSQQSKA